MRELKIGDHIQYVDSVRQVHNALVTEVFPNLMSDGKAGCNLVYVVDDETRDDQYGRQIERQTSVVHLDANPAPGNYWQWHDEPAS